MTYIIPKCDKYVKTGNVGITKDGYTSNVKTPEIVKGILSRTKSHMCAKIKVSKFKKFKNNFAGSVSEEDRRNNRTKKV